MGVNTDRYSLELSEVKDPETSIDTEHRISGLNNPHPDDGTNFRLGEASEIYGDYQTAEEFGYVSRGYVHQNA